MEENKTNKEEPQIAESVPDQADLEKNRGMAIIAYFLFFIPLVTDAKNSPFAKFHSKQSLLLLLASLAGAVVKVVPVIGGLLSPLVTLAVLVLWVIGLVNAANGKMTPVPYIGHYAEEWFKY